MKRKHSAIGGRAPKQARVEETPFPLFELPPELLVMVLKDCSPMTRYGLRASCAQLADFVASAEAAALVPLHKPRARLVDAFRQGESGLIQFTMDALYRPPIRAASCYETPSKVDEDWTKNLERLILRHAPAKFWRGNKCGLVPLTSRFCHELRYMTSHSVALVKNPDIVAIFKVLCKHKKFPGNDQINWFKMALYSGGTALCNYLIRNNPAWWRSFRWEATFSDCGAPASFWWLLEHGLEENRCLKFSNPFNWFFQADRAFILDYIIPKHSSLYALTVENEHQHLRTIVRSLDIWMCTITGHPNDPQLYDGIAKWRGLPSLQMITSLLNHQSRGTVRHLLKFKVLQESRFYAFFRWWFETALPQLGPEQLELEYPIPRFSAHKEYAHGLTIATIIAPRAEFAWLVSKRTANALFSGMITSLCCFYYLSYAKQWSHQPHYATYKQRRQESAARLLLWEELVAPLTLEQVTNDLKTIRDMAGNEFVYVYGPYLEAVFDYLIASPHHNTAHLKTNRDFCYTVLEFLRKCSSEFVSECCRTMELSW